MPLATDLSVSPYSDDFDATKNFSKVLFRPGPAVQTRELNQLQTLLQTQIERIGDNVFKRGTIVDGCSFSFYDDYQYVKLLDADSTGEAINVSKFMGMFVTDESTGVTAQILNVTQGFEATAPDLNTLYVRYIKAGAAGEITFNPSSQLVVTDLDRTISSVEVLNNVSGFSNNDVAVFMPAVLVQNATGGTAFSNGASFVDLYTPGKVLTQNLSSTTAKAVIVSANATYKPGHVLLNLRPLTNSLVGVGFSNGQFITENTFQANTTVPVSANGAESYIKFVIGEGAQASVQTTSAGRIEDGLGSIVLSSGGFGYDVRPYVTVASATANTNQVEQLQIQARNYLSRVTVANATSNSIGSGYAFAVSEGVIYQKGYFTRVAPQTVVVEKYRTSKDGYPDAKVVGFDTIESIVNSNTDYTLLDISNTRNATAPGADRLVLTPQLVVMSTQEVEANTEFFSILEFARGVPFKQIQDTQYNSIEANMAKRTYESSGNFVMDQFIVNTVSEPSLNKDAESFSMVVDPGAGYIAGRRVQTVNNYVVSVRKGIDTVVTSDINVDINLGNFLEVEQLAGMFPASKMVKVELRTAKANYYNNTVGTTPSAAGDKIGTARVRAVTSVDGIPGNPNARYRLYLFDVIMDAGKNFSAVQSVFYNGTDVKAVADVIGTAVLRETANSSLVFPTKFSAVKSMAAANIEFVTRSTVVNAAANGLSATSTLVIAAGPNGSFPYSGELTDSELRDIIITPNANVVANAALSGTISANATTITGTGTAFATELFPGAFVRAGAETRRIVSIANNTSALTAGTTGTLSGVAFNRILPKDVPISLADLPGASAQVLTGNTNLQIALGFISSVPSFGVNVTFNKTKKQSSNAAAKSSKRRVFVRLKMSNHDQGINGPWCLGMPDAFRLRNVYRSTTAGATSNDENITSAFYIDNNHNENYLDLSYLVRLPNSKFNLTTADQLLVEFDVFQNPADRPFTIDSYNVDDTISPLMANNTIHTAEVPQFFTIKGDYVDLRDYVDFRPAVVATANVLANTSTATVNPAETRVIDETQDKSVPVPQSDLKFTVEAYQPRADRVILTSNGSVKILAGYPSASYQPQPEPKDSLTLDILNIPAYPSVPMHLNQNVEYAYDTKTGSEKILTTRSDRYRIKSSAKYDRQASQQRRYSMADIGSIERRMKSVESAVTLSLVEQEISDLVIPSSLDTNEVRFKFGFAIDNFNGLKLSDVTNPQFNATIFNGRLTPKKKQLNVSFVEESGTKVVTLPRAADYKFVSQNIATDGAVIPPEPPIPPVVIVPPPPPPPVPPPPPPLPTAYLTTQGDVAHICGLIPGQTVFVDIIDPRTQNIYMTVNRIVSDTGCIEVPIITYPPPPPVVVPDPPVVVPPTPVPEDPVVVNPPVVTPVSPPPPPPVIVVTPEPPPPPPAPPVSASQIVFLGRGPNAVSVAYDQAQPDLPNWVVGEGRGTEVTYAYISNDGVGTGPWEVFEGKNFTGASIVVGGGVRNETYFRRVLSRVNSARPVAGGQITYTPPIIQVEIPTAPSVVSSTGWVSDRYSRFDSGINYMTVQDFQEF